MCVCECVWYKQLSSTKLSWVYRKTRNMDTQ